MDEHVVVEHPLPYHITASTTQHSRKASIAVRADQSATTQASRQRASYLLYCSTASTAQHSSQPAQTRKASTCRSECDDASKQRWREPAHVVEHLYSTLSFQNELRHRNLPGLQKYSTTTAVRTHSAGVMREEFAFNFDLYKITTHWLCSSVFLSVLAVRFVRA